MTLVEARLAVLRALNASGEWGGPAVELDGEAARILAVDLEDGPPTCWIVTVRRAAVTARPAPPEPDAAASAGAP